MIIGRQVRVAGHVQGVFFRAWAQGHARELGVSGWIRNCADGSVEAHLAGEEAAVERMIDRLHRGPPAAEVEHVRQWDVEACDFDGFEIRH
jgi:acylphosphatase